jgi:hypothetical protein
VASGLSATKKGVYPVTVGVGFSSAEIICSPDQINFTGISEPDLCIAVSQDGLNKITAMVNSMRHGKVYCDASLDIQASNVPLVRFDYRSFDGPKNAALWALIHTVQQNRLFPVEAFMEAIKAGKSAERIDFNKLSRLQ